MQRILNFSTLAKREGCHRVARWICGALSCLAWAAQAAGESSPTGLGATFRGTPLPDAVYLQEVGQQVPSAEPLSGVGIWKDEIWVSHAQGLLRLSGLNWTNAISTPDPIHRLRYAGGRLWGLAAQSLWTYDGQAWTSWPEAQIRDVTEHRGEAVFARGRQLWRVAKTGGRLELFTDQNAPFEIRHLAAHLNTLTVAGTGRLTFLNRGRFGGMDTYGFPSDQAIDWGEWSNPDVRDLASAQGSLWLATGRGLGRLRGMTLETLDGGAGLPIEEISSLAPGFAQDLWAGTAQGLVRWMREGFSYYAGRRWLPGSQVRGIAVLNRTVYCATEAGLGVIRFEPYTLAKKADYYERYLDAWGLKRLGFTHKLEWDDTQAGFVREVSDNDGGYSGDYLAAQSYRWAVTRDPAARREATNTFHALRWLEQMTGIPGFPARAVWAKGEIGHKSAQGSGGYPAEWHDTSDGPFEWKGDTSSDEICSHFYAIGLFLELAAEGEEVAQAKRHLARLARHLLDHGWRLVDRDGQPTRWGRWDPDYFKTDEGRFDRGLQALEILSFMKAAAHFTGDAAFSQAYEQLVRLGYPEYTLRQRSTFPPEDMAHFEDQLAFWCWWNLLRFEADPDLRAFYQRGYERSFETVRVEQNPWYNFLYGALTGHPAEEAVAVAHLQEWPLDLRVWSFHNSHRADLRTPAGYRTYKGGIRAFSPREREPMRWDAWALRLDGGAGGRDVMECGSWLLAYWMGRYHGFIAAPTATEERLIKSRPEDVPAGGAAAYRGPGRPLLP